MTLTDVDRMLVDLLQREDERAQAESRARWQRFSGLLAERSGIPIEHLGIDVAAGLIFDQRARVLGDEHAEA